MTTTLCDPVTLGYHTRHLHRDYESSEILVQKLWPAAILCSNAIWNIAAIHSELPLTIP